MHCWNATTVLGVEHVRPCAAAEADVAAAVVRQCRMERVAARLCNDVTKAEHPNVSHHSETAEAAQKEEVPFRQDRVGR